MRVSPFLLLLLVVSVPLLSVGIVLVTLNYEFVAWRSPLAWSQEFGAIGSGITGGIGNRVENDIGAVAVNGSSLYAVGELGLPFFPAPNATSGSLFVRRYDLSGNLIWSHVQGSLKFDQFLGISAANGGVYVGGMVNGTAALEKYDALGNQVWTRQFGSRGNVRAVFSLAENVYLAGVSSPLTNQGFTGPVLYVRDYDSNGNIVWTNEFSNSTGDAVTGLYADSSAIYILTAQSLLKYDPSGNMLWMSPRGGDGISGDGSSVYVTNESLITPPSIPSGFLTSYRPNGSVDWSVRFDPPDHSGYYHSFVSADSSGAHWAVNSGGGRVYMIKYDARGNQAWNFLTPSSRSSQWSSSDIASGSNGIYLSGSIVVASGDRLALLEGFGKDGSLIFLGLNPPWSFIAVGVTSVVLGTGIVWYARRRKRNMRLGVGLAEPRLPSYVPADIASAE